jgi:hypothetical protein
MNPAFVDAVARTCVERMAREIRSRSSVTLAGLEAAGVARVAGAFYQLSTGMVEFLDQPRPAWRLNSGNTCSHIPRSRLSEAA